MSSLLVALGLAHRKAADGVAVEADPLESRERLVAQRLEHAALNDAEQRVGIAFVGALRALGPAQGKAHRLAGFALAGRIRRALVEHHDDVGAEDALDAHRFLGREEEAIAVHGRCEAHAFLGDLAELPEAEDLVAARIRENRARPAHEAVQPAVRGDHLQPRAQPQVEGVAEENARAVLRELGRAHRLDCAVGPDGHEHRRLDLAVREREGAAAGCAIGGGNRELHRGILSISIASPYE